MKFEFSIFDILLEPCIIINKDQQIVYCNETAAILLGVSVRKAIRSGYKVDSLIEFDEVVEGIANVKEVTMATAIKEVSFKTKLAENRGKIQISVQPLNAENTEQLWIVFIRDVTLEERLQHKYQGELEQKEVIINDLKDAKRMLQDYSKNLELKVQERTLELSSINQTMKTLLDSLHQGFFIFDKNGVCLSVYSEACNEILETKPAGKNLSEVLNVENEDKEKLNDWVNMLFEQIIVFEDAVTFGPTTYNHSKGKIVELAYYPIYDAQQKLTGVVAVATDITSLVEIRKEAELEKNNAKLVLNIVKNRKQIQNFISDCKEIINQLNFEFGKPELNRDAAELFRSLHTLKGGASSFSISDLTEHCHLAEDLLTDIKNHKGEGPSFSEKWKNLVELVKQIEKDFNRFLNYTEQLVGNSLSKERILEISFSQFIDVIHKTDQVFSSESIKQVLTEEFLMESAEEFVKGYQDTIDKVSRVLNKQILPLNIKNGHIKIIPEYYKNLFNSLIHVIRNAVDHGIEKPETRISLGKPHAGKITIEFQLVNDILKINVEDDGNGIDPKVVREKLLEKGIETSTETNEQVIQHIFDQGFSTKREISSISGRGVGMDAVMAAVQNLKGKVRIHSKVGQGAVITIEVPYLRNLTRSNLKKNLQVA